MGRGKVEVGVEVKFVLLDRFFNQVLSLKKFDDGELTLGGHKDDYYYEVRR